MSHLTEKELLAMSEDDYMNQAQLEYFERLLLSQKAATMEEIEEAKTRLGSPPESNDEGDRAQYEEESALLIRLIDRKRRLLPKIDLALTKIHKGTFGYCVETDEPIGIKRLLIRPTAEYSTDAKEIHENREKHFRL
ncbi:molecular chaperone DnaK [Aliidiomarina minuta]|uniref:Molecular chaperone DnaK n=1 Tax=Aliidiomarina minuta TaxID=880057 RepID=A0A432W9R8_9GAMM|nr:TraR/DksA C4-type zinc finger protein [Aliidiomarina minuta]RUO26900.1 molecular chaperone DnaK [Aliidiomarina minuta]